MDIKDELFAALVAELDEYDKYLLIMGLTSAITASADAIEDPDACAEDIQELKEDTLRAAEMLQMIGSCEPENRVGLTVEMKAGSLESSMPEQVH